MKLTTIISAAAFVALSACAPTDYAERSETVARTLTVREIDRENRSFAVTGDGQRFTLTVSEAVVNFDQIEVGDKLNVTYVESVAVGMAVPEDSGETIAIEGAVVAPEGAKPGIADAKLVSRVVEFVSYDPGSKIVVLRLNDGSIYST
ncbi:MAG TPA: hypothetical protein VLA51_08905, partial [Paracoccaceae bacterium]|nr:hypothetical protein [Paracoccaceae bacterium]